MAWQLSCEIHEMDIRLPGAHSIDPRRVVAFACFLQFLFDATFEKARQTMLEGTHVSVKAVEYDYQIEALVGICRKH